MKWKSEIPLKKWEIRKKEMAKRGDPGPIKRLSNRQKKAILRELDRLYYPDGFTRPPKKVLPDWLVQQIGFMRVKLI